LSDAANRNQAATGNEDNSLRNDAVKKIGWYERAKKIGGNAWCVAKEKTVSMMTLIVNQILKCHEIKLRHFNE